MTAHAERAAPYIEVDPPAPLADDRLSIRVSGLTPGGRVVVGARWWNPLGQLMRSEGTFVADERGVVDLTAQAPLEGSYDGIDAMGLFWSMAPDGTAPPERGRAWRVSQPMIAELTVETGGDVVARRSVERSLLAPGTTWLPVRDDGLAGTLVLPPGTGPHPGVIVLGGSGGGLPEGQAALLASRGFAALALAYFAFEHLPADLVEIPLEYVDTAIGWLQRRAEVRRDGLAVVGSSKGGELALLVGATFPAVTAVVGYVPSHVIHAAVTRSRGEERSSWSHVGVPLPWATTPAGFTPAAAAGGGPYRIRPGYEARLQDPEVVERAAIPVERINGPVLLVSGEDDQMWPSAPMAEAAIERLARHGHAFPFTHLCYPDAGHAIGIPYMPALVSSGPHPVTGFEYLFGGTREATAFASADSWSRVQRFLWESLGG